MKRLMLALAFSGCASTVPVTHPSVAAAGRQAQLCVDGRAPRGGQSVRVQRSVCRADAKAPGRAVCALEPIGAGEVVRTLDAHCAVVSIASDVTIGRGDVIEVGGAPAPASSATAIASTP